MIENPTVLILGAGACMPYRFPSGISLKKMICHELRVNNTGPSRQIQKLGFDEDLVLAFRNALYYSGKTSVDAFLEHREEFIDVGKIAIAQSLIPFEKTNNLFEIEENDWYQYLFNKLNAPFDEFGENKISIITYNYDRSLEHYLFTTLKASYGQDSKACAEKIGEIPIIHLYGKLGDLSYMGDNIIPYDVGFPNENQLKKAASGIRIITEKFTDYTDFNQANELITKAKYVYFIGFGYNEVNLDRLRLSYIPADYHNKISFLGTALELSEQEITDVRKYFERQHLRINLSKQNAYQFIRNIPLK